MPRDGGEVQVLLDGDAMAKGLPYFDFGGTRHSPDHRLEAWSADVRGSEFFTIRVRDWQTGADLPDVIEQTSGSVVWGRDSTLLLLRPARRQSSAAAHLSPSAGHAAERGRAGLRRAGQRLVRARRGKRVGPLLHRRHRQPGDLRALADRPQPRRRRAAPGGGARDRRALQRLRPRGRALHPDQPGRCHRLSHRRGAAGARPIAATGAS